MEDLLACRVCLTTGVKLHDMYNYRLEAVFEELTGISISVKDRNPHYLCVFCTQLLLKCNTFKESCIRSQELLVDTDISVITEDIIKNLTVAHSPTQYLTVSLLQTSTTILPQDLSVKEENYELILKEETLISGFESDEEPLSHKAQKKKEIDYSNSEIDDNFDTEAKLDYSEFENDSNDKQRLDTIDSFDKQKVLVLPEEIDFETEPFEEKVENCDVGKDFNTNEIEVITLSKQQQIDEVLARKYSFNYQNSFYKCDLCFKGFITDYTFKNHMERHASSSGRIPCEVCHTRWPDVRSLKGHITTAHKRRYNCKLCDHTTKSCHRAKEHVKWHLGHNFICNICGATFAKSTSHLTHVRLQHPSKFSCDVCGAKLLSQNGLNIHKKKAHRNNEDSKRTHHYQCAICDVYFNSINALGQHTRLSENGICDTSQCPCPKCGENFPNEELLTQHQKTHQAEDPARCDECNRTFANERSYAIHYQRKHLGVKRNYKREDVRTRPTVVCEMCGKKCISNTTLILHQRTHTGEKPYQCKECPKKFSVQQRLQIHIRTHTNERPFKCTHCPKAFKHKAALNRHDRVHTGAKPYQCPHCSKSFSQSNSMKMHVKTVHLKLPAPYRNKRNNKVIE